METGISNPKMPVQQTLFEQAAEGREIISDIFEGATIRALDINGERWTAIYEVGNAAKLDRRTIERVVKRINLTFTGCSMSTQRGHMGDTNPLTMGKNTTLLNREGMMHFFQMINVERLDSQESKDIIRRLQEWTARFTGSVLSGETEKATIEKLAETFRPIDPRVEPFGDYFVQQMQIAQILFQTRHVDIGMMTSIAINNTEKKYNEDLSGFRNCLPLVKTEDVPYLIATTIAEKLGWRSPQEANRIMKEAGLQYKERKLWFPTELGKPHCLLEPFTARNGHSEYQLKWKESILSVLTQWESDHPDMFSY